MDNGIWTGRDPYDDVTWKVIFLHLLFLGRRATIIRGMPKLLFRNGITFNSPTYAPHRLIILPIPRRWYPPHLVDN